MAAAAVRYGIHAYEQAQHTPRGSGPGCCLRHRHDGADNPAADPSRVYYGTDTRVFSLLLGAWMAFIPDRDLAPVRLAHRLGLNRLAGAAKHGKNAEGKHDATTDGAAETVPTQPSTLVRFWSSPASIDVLGVVGLVGLAAMVALTNGYTAFQYRGGTLLCSILTLMVIAACVQPQGMVARALSAEPLVWVGKRSYSIYLWHYPLLLLMNPVANINDTPWWQYILQVVVGGRRSRMLISLYRDAV